MPVAIGLAVIVAVIVPVVSAQTAVDAARAPLLGATPAASTENLATPTDSTPVAVARATVLPESDAILAELPPVDWEPIRLSHVCPFIGHHAASHELFRFLTRVDEAVFALDPAIAHLALLVDRTLRGQAEPICLMAASGAVADAVRQAPALGFREQAGPTLFVNQFKLIRGLVVVAQDAQTTLINVFMGNAANRSLDEPARTGSAMTTIVGLVEDLGYSIEYRDNMSRRLLPFAGDLVQGC